jgi:ABC-type glutathione transport system ATPase component
MESPVKSYSTGMYARLAFAVAVTVEPDILLLDEVLSVGDESFQLRCSERMAEFRADGRTIVLVSHSLDTVRNLCSRAVWIDKGVVKAAGESHDVVATYLGEVYQEEYHHEERHEERAEDGAPSETPRLGTGEAEITDVHLLDSADAPASSFRTGDPMTIRISYRFKKHVERASCGVAVFRAENLAYLFGHNSRDGGVDLVSTPEGTIEYTVPALPLLPGGYVITVALHDTVKRIYDYRDREYSFVVFKRPGMPDDDGIVQVASQWKLSATSVSV